MSPRASAEATRRGRSSAIKSHLIRNAALAITVDPDLGDGPLGLLHDVDILIEGDRIAALGPELDAPGARVVDASDRIVMPGFVDVHDHLWQSLIRGRGADQELPQWLESCVFAMEPARITREEAHAGVRLSTLGLVETGVTMVVNWSQCFNGEFTAGSLDALDASGIRYLFGYHASSPQGPDAIRRAHEDLCNHPLAAGMHICSHPSRAARRDLMAAASLARELGVSLDVHLLEHASQRDDDPIDLLEEAGAIGPSLLVDHAVHLTEDEIAGLVARGVRATHNPLSNMRLASGIMALAKWRAAGASLGLGLDGGTNDTPDMFNNMRAAVGLQRAVARSASVYPSVAEVLRMATLGGAEALGLQACIGSLTPGKQADLIVVDPGGINFAPRGDPLSQLVFCGQPHNVTDVFVAGRPLKRAGRHVAVDTRAVVRDAERAAASIWSRVGS